MVITKIGRRIGRAASIYFHDVDGHWLEFIADIHHEPVPEIGIVSLSEWNDFSPT